MESGSTGPGKLAPDFAALHPGYACCLSTAMIRLSVKRDFFKGTSSGWITRKFHF
jgi:hypothetical protein